MNFPALAGLILQTGLAFSDVRAWRWSDGRGEFIPAFHAMAENRTGQDYRTVRVLVRVRCRQGGERSYTVHLRDVLLGRQRVEATAYDFIGSVPYCDGPVEAIPQETVPYPEQERPAFAVLGFSARLADGTVVRDLAGVLDYRAPNDGPPSVELRSWKQNGGARLALPDLQDTVFYVIRIPPGRFGLAGFVLDVPSGPDRPLSRFLRYYEIPPGQAGWLGIFRVEAESYGRASCTIEPSPDLLPRLAPLLPRPLTASRGIAPAPGSALVIQ